MLSFLLAISFGILQIQPWVRLVEEQGQFSLETPGEMEMTTQQIETELGPIDYVTYHHSIQNDSSGSFTFLISFYKLSEGIVPLTDKELVNEFLDATIGESSTAVGGEVIFQDDITYKGTYPGRFWRMHFSEGATVMKSKAFLTNDFFYSLQVAVDEDHSLSPVIDRFFDSFQITEK